MIFCHFRVYTKVFAPLINPSGLVIVASKWITHVLA